MDVMWQLESTRLDKIEMIPRCANDCGVISSLSRFHSFSFHLREATIISFDVNSSSSNLFTWKWRFLSRFTSLSFSIPMPPTLLVRLFTAIYIQRCTSFNRFSWINSKTYNSDFSFICLWFHIDSVVDVSHYKSIDPQNKNKNSANHITKIHSQIK